MDICPKLIVIGWLEFELAYFEAAAQPISLCTMRTLPLYVFEEAWNKYNRKYSGNLLIQKCLYSIEKCDYDVHMFFGLTVFCCSSLYTHTHTHTHTYIYGVFNKFPDFFVQAFKIVVDSWKFTMLLLYILWDDWPIFMISRLNQQL